MAFGFAQVSLDDLEPKPKTKKEQYTELFGKMCKLQIIAASKDIISDRDWFIRGGIPAEFYDNLIKCHLITENKGQMVYFNKDKNLLYPNCTWNKFLESVKD